MKKAIFMALIFALSYAITACGSSGEEQTTNTKSEAGTNAPALSDAESEETKQSDEEAQTVQTELQPTESVGESSKQEVTDMKMKIQIKDMSFTATLEDNSSVDALRELMADGPITLNMSDYANMEKGADLGVALPQNNEQMNTQAGDIILYQGKTLVIYYDTNSWSLTPIGKIDNVNEEELRTALGTGDVTVTFSLE